MGRMRPGTLGAWGAAGTGGGWLLPGLPPLCHGVTPLPVFPPQGVPQSPLVLGAGEERGCCHPGLVGSTEGTLLAPTLLHAPIVTPSPRSHPRQP